MCICEHFIYYRTADFFYILELNDTNINLMFAVYPHAHTLIMKTLFRHNKARIDSELYTVFQEKEANKLLAVTLSNLNRF